MTRKTRFAKVIEREGAIVTSYRVEWWHAGARQRTPAYKDHEGGRARAYLIAGVVDERRGAITADEAASL
jgi:protocatechuate 3,4-dioxygenase beta subunit